MGSILISLSLEHCSFHYFCYLHMKRFTYGSLKYEKTITFKILYLYIYLLERSWNRKKFLSASFNDNCLVTRRAVTLKTVLFCTTRIIFSCLTFFPDNNLVYSCKKHQPRTFWKLIALFNREVRSDKGCVACPMHMQSSDVAPLLFLHQRTTTMSLSFSWFDLVVMSSVTQPSNVFAA